MSKTSIFKMTSLAIFTILFSLGGSAQTFATNILTNAGFELGNTNGWVVSNPSGQSYTFGVTTDSSKVRSGTHAAHVSSYAGTQSIYITNSGSVSGIAEGKMILARVYIKTENLHFQDPITGVGMNLVGWGSTGNVITWNSGGASLTGTNSYGPIEIITKLAPGVVTAQLQVVINSPITSGSFYIDDASIESFETIGGTRSDIIDCKLLKDSRGTPRLTINGKATAPVIFMGNNQAGNDVIYDEMAKAASVGVDLNQICMDLPWTGLSNGVIERVLKANPKALVFPRIFIYPPQSWIDAHPDQTMKTESGTVSPASGLPSLASDLFFNEIKNQINLFVRYIHNSAYKDKIIGYHYDYLSGGEWFYSDADQHYYDYSEVNRQKFAQWAQAKFGTISALNAAWNKSYGDFDDIQIPPLAELEAGDDGFFRNPSVHRAAADYAYYFNNLTASRMIELADYTKSLTYNKSLTGFFYGYQLELIGNSSAKGLGNGAHMGLRQVLASPSVDVISAPVSYYDRQPGRPNGMMSIVDSVTVAGKLFLEEEDARTWLWTPVPTGWSASLYFPTEWDSLQCLRRDFGNVISHNQATWWMDLSANGNFNAQSIWDNNKILTDTYKDSIDNQQPTTPQVALIYDQEFYTWLKANSYALNIQNGYIQRTIFQALGAQVGYYYIQDIPKIPSSVKLYVFVDTFNIDAQKKALIDTIKTNNNTLLWLYAPGFVTETNLSVSNMQNITGFNLAKQSSPMDPAITIGSSNPISQGIAGQSFGSIGAIAPTFYGTGSDGSTILGNYNSNSQPGLMLKEFSNWRSIFCGSPILSVPVLRSICRYAGAPLLVDPENMFTEDAVTYNGRYLYIYARTHPGKRTLQVPGNPVTVVDVLTGTELARGVNRWDVNIAENEQKIFKVMPLGIGAQPDLTVTNVSRPDYVVATDELQAGDLVYGDRMYVFSNPIPAKLYKKTFIMTAQEDRDTTTPAAFLTFDVNREVIVYVAIDKRITKLPTWLSSWSVMADPLITTDTGEKNRRVYSKKFAAGQVTLGPNRDQSMTKGYSMYSVVIVPVVTGIKDWNLY